MIEVKKMDKQNDKSVCLVLFIFSIVTTLLFFYLLFVFSCLVLWIEIPTTVTLGFSTAVFWVGFGYLLIKARRKKRQELAAVSRGAIMAPLVFLIVIFTPSLRKTDDSSKGLPNRQQNIASPSGQYILSVPVVRIRRKRFSFGNPYWQVTISDPNRNVVYRDKEKTFPGWFGTYWIWDQQDRVWVYGSDDGAIYYYENIDGNWIKHLWKKESRIKPPELLH